MKLIRVHIISAQTCGGLLDGLDLRLRQESAVYNRFEPLCFVGPNGSGKSQLLQIIAEICQSICHACDNSEERLEGNPDLLFEIEYLIRPENSKAPIHVRARRVREGTKTSGVLLEQRRSGEWVGCDMRSAATRRLLPRKIVGYTSGDNETLSLPFLVSRSAYADDVRDSALIHDHAPETIPDNRLMLIDYGTHLEVLVANLLLGGAEMRRALLQDANVSDIHSCRCIIQLAHGAVPKAPGKRRPETGRKGVQLTDELEEYIDDLKKCSTCYDYDPEDEVYIFDYWVNDQTRTAFAHFWKNALQLYASLHKLAMLNDLAIPRTARKRFRRDTKARRFASRLPEPQDEEKVFRFEAVRFSPQGKGVPVDYVSLSDGEHQLTQLLGVMCMQDSPGILFLLDEPESHFNPLWRVKCISRLLSMPTNTGCRSQENKTSLAAEQECILTTHAPFVPSDLPREHVFIFKKEDGRINVVHPDMETYGTTFDTILEQCFGVHPPISRVSLSEIERLRSSNNVTAIKNALVRIGDSVEKAVLMDRIHELANNEKSV